MIPALVPQTTTKLLVLYKKIFDVNNFVVRNFCGGHHSGLEASRSCAVKSISIIYIFFCSNIKGVPRSA